MPFPPPLFSLALPLHVAYSLTPPQTSSFALNAPPPPTLFFRRSQVLDRTMLLAAILVSLV